MGRVYKNESKILLAELLEIYEMSNFDWLSYQITKQNTLTIHHIIKESEGGLLCFDNAAMLTKRAHRIINICECKDYLLYSEINDYFKEIIARRTYLDDDLIKQSKEYKKALNNLVYGER